MTCGRKSLVLQDSPSWRFRTTMTWIARRWGKRKLRSVLVQPAAESLLTHLQALLQATLEIPPGKGREAQLAKKPPPPIQPAGVTGQVETQLPIKQNHVLHAGLLRQEAGGGGKPGSERQAVDLAERKN